MTALNARETRILVRLLGVLQTNLESAIECALIPETNEAPKGWKRDVRIDRTDWRAAEDLIIKLTARKRKRKVP